MLRLRPLGHLSERTYLQVVMTMIRYAIDSLFAIHHHFVTKQAGKGRGNEQSGGQPRKTGFLLASDTFEKEL